MSIKLKKALCRRMKIHEWELSGNALVKESVIANSIDDILYRKEIVDELYYCIYCSSEKLIVKEYVYHHPTNELVRETVKHMAIKEAKDVFKYKKS